MPTSTDHWSFECLVPFILRPSDMSTTDIFGTILQIQIQMIRTQNVLFEFQNAQNFYKNEDQNIEMTQRTKIIRYITFTLLDLVSELPSKQQKQSGKSFNIIIDDIENIQFNVIPNIIGMRKKQ